MVFFSKKTFPEHFYISKQLFGKKIRKKIVKKKNQAWSKYGYQKGPESAKNQKLRFFPLIAAIGRLFFKKSLFI